MFVTVHESSNTSQVTTSGYHTSLTRLKLVNTTGELVASISHDNRVKFWNVAYLEEMDYDKTKKPLVLPKSMVRSKSKKLAAAREVEHQLPSSGRSNKAEFFQGLKPE